LIWSIPLNPLVFWAKRTGPNGACSMLNSNRDHEADLHGAPFVLCWCTVYVRERRALASVGTDACKQGPITLAVAELAVQDTRLRRQRTSAHGCTRQCMARLAPGPTARIWTSTYAVTLPLHAYPSASSPFPEFFIF